MWPSGSCFTSLTLLWGHLRLAILSPDLLQNLANKAVKFGQGEQDLALALAPTHEVPLE